MPEKSMVVTGRASDLNYLLVTREQTPPPVQGISGTRHKKRQIVSPTLTDCGTTGFLSP